MCNTNIKHYVLCTFHMQTKKLLLIEVFQGSSQVFGVKLAGVAQLISDLLSENLHLTNL